MSAGNFTRTFYESDGNVVYRARVQPETLALDIGGSTNDAPAGPATGEGSAKMNGGTRELGINARSVTLAWTATPPTGYDANAVVRVPVMTPAFFQAISLGDTGTYLGAAIEVVSLKSEAIN
jgi:hypothetical protein